MTFLERLTPDQRETVISLPYRVGLWVSQSDSSGGAEAEQQELQALSSIIHGFAEEMFGSETTQRIISGTLAHRDKWPQWAQRTSGVPDDCRFVVDLMQDYTDAKDVNAFRNHLMEIGEAVALAFRERSSSSFIHVLGRYLAYTFSGGNKSAKGPRRSFSEFLRISASERKALMSLAHSLGTTY